jgi:hypothetical protein
MLESVPDRVPFAKVWLDRFDDRPRRGARVRVGSAVMSEQHGADRVGGGEASLGDAQSSNPPDDPEMIFEDAEPLDTDTDYEGEDPEPPEERGNEDPARNMP